VEALVTRRENAGRAEKLSPAERSEYLKAEPLVPLDGPVLALAREAVRGKRTVAEKARAIYAKVTALVRYDKSGTGWGRGDALYACDARAGNCTDFHALIIGMARSQGIPARFAIGFSIPAARGTGEIAGYHCWAELYVDGVWIPIDSSEASKALAAGRPELKDYFYGHHDADRVELSRGRHLTLSPPQKGGPINFFIYPYAEADGKPLTTVEREFRYSDVTDP
jgi:transglutaminase-like putative cysteine protease